MKSDSKINYYLTNLNVANIIMGCTFAVSLIMPLKGNAEEVSIIITLPYRGLSYILIYISFFLNLKSIVKLSTPIFFCVLGGDLQYLSYCLLPFRNRKFKMIPWTIGIRTSYMGLYYVSRKKKYR